jgi:hypothetical protein
MLYSLLKGLRIRLGVTLIALGWLLSACATPIVFNRPASDCSTLIPKPLRDPTPGAPLPADGTKSGWVIFGDAQTGQLEKSNVVKASVIQIVEACEARDRAAEKQLTKKKGLF